MARYGKGITNPQAKLLGALCRELRVPYSGRGMTREEASVTIEAMQAKVKKRNAMIRKKIEGA